jgi:hypothetical protein
MRLPCAIGAAFGPTMSWKAEMDAITIRDLFGEPEAWGNHISDGLDGMPDMDGARIVDVFVSGNQVAIYTRNDDGVEALSIFFVDDPKVRERVALALAPGSRVHDAVGNPI